MKSLKKLFITHAGTTFPIGTVFCFPHLKECNSDGNYNDGCTEEVNGNNVNNEKDDVDYVPDEIQPSDESMEMADEASLSICSLDTSPLSFQVKRKRVDELSSKMNLVAKYRKVKRQLKKKFAEAAAPGQVEEFMAKVLGDSPDEDNDEIEEIAEKLVELLRLYPEVTPCIQKWLHV